MIWAIDNKCLLLLSVTDMHDTTLYCVLYITIYVNVLPIIVNSMANNCESSKENHQVCET